MKLIFLKTVPSVEHKVLQREEKWFTSDEEKNTAHCFHDFIPIPLSLADSCFTALTLVSTKFKKFQFCVDSNVLRLVLLAF